MASIRGTDTNVILKQGTTHGTAVSGGSTDKLPVESISVTRNASELSSNEIGTGLSMATDMALGETTYNVDITMQMGYNNGAETWLALFMGASTASPAEENTGEGDYKHVITYSPSVKKFATIAHDTSSTTVVECPSCYPANISISTSPFNYLELSGSWVANTALFSSTTNSNASLASATIANKRKIVAQRNDVFLVNAQGGGALSSSTDKVCASNVTLNLMDEKAIQNCFSGSESAGAPIRTDLFSGDLQLEFLEMEDHTWINYRNNETALKCGFIVDGAQIGAGENYTFSFYIPRMVVTSVDHSISSAGVNGFTVTCKILKADSNPTGMTSTYPYFEVINTQSTALIS